MFKRIKGDDTKIAKQAPESGRAYDLFPGKVRHSMGYRIPGRFDDDLARQDDLNLVYGRKRRIRVRVGVFMSK